jgi:hypothetical protein
MISQQIHIYIYVRSNIVILHQDVSVTVRIIIRVAYNKNTINIQIIVKNVWYYTLFMNQMCHQVVLSYIFVRLFVYWLYSYHKPPDYGHSSDRKKLVKNSDIWLNIL